MKFWIVFLTAFFLAMIFTPVAIKIAPKIGAVDIPKDGRRMHTKPMPRFGGLAIFIGTTAAFVLFLRSEPAYLGIIIGGALIYVLGIIDDLRGMPAKVKLVGQIVCASVAYGFGVRISFITAHFAGEGHIFFGGALCYFVTVIWIVGITNTINLIDGLDGLAAGVSAIASLCIAYTAYVHGYYPATFAMLAVAGGALGFLPFNFHPAKIFMGDGGSLFLGFMLASISAAGSLKGSALIATAIPVLVLGIPIFDTAFAILRRFVNHRPIMEADKGHLHHRLIAEGLGQRRAVLMLYGISAIMGVAAVLLSRDLFVETAGLVAIAAMYIYVFLTDANHWKLSIKNCGVASEKAKDEQSQAPAEGNDVKAAEAPEGEASSSESFAEGETNCSDVAVGQEVKTAERKEQK